MLKNPPVTITLNPAIDETVLLGNLKIGEVNRSRFSQTQAGGKGTNVSRMLSQYGISNLATGFLGADNRGHFTNLFAHNQIEDAFIQIPGKTRSCIKIVCESTRQTTDINLPGLSPSPAAKAQFSERIQRLIFPGRWFVLAGSLPPGLDLEFFTHIIQTLKQGGALVAVDSSGDPLKAAIEQKVDLIKPNEHELAEIWKHPLSDFSEKVEAAKELQQNHVPRVILSLGKKGALFLSPEQTLLASVMPVEVVSTVGAGDALLSGYLAGVLNEESHEDCARLATVFASSNLENVERTLPPPAEILRRLAKVQIIRLSE
ncbi:1-phosphofructokinase [Kiritimatiellaeota bacterium B1221]|nr:1-phosphofructokinase [Kiritimatiellaeota bacterium B1221]